VIADIRFLSPTVAAEIPARASMWSCFQTPPLFRAMCSTAEPPAQPPSQSRVTDPHWCSPRPVARRAPAHPRLCRFARAIAVGPRAPDHLLVWRTSTISDALIEAGAVVDIDDVPAAQPPREYRVAPPFALEPLTATMVPP